MPNRRINSPRRGAGTVRQAWYPTCASFTFRRYDIAGLDFLFIAALISGFVMAVYVSMTL